MRLSGKLLGLGVEGATPVPMRVWRLTLVAEEAEGTTETELARIERREAGGLADLGLSLEEVKHLTAALQAKIVTAQAAMPGRAGSHRAVPGYGNC